MKKLTLLFGLIAISVFLFAQGELQIPQAQKAEKNYKLSVAEYNSYNQLKSAKSTKAAGDTIWYEDFGGGSIPLGWTIVDNTGLGYDWIWTTDPPTGEFTNEPAIASTTGFNGFMLLNGDAYNTPGGTTNMDAYFQTDAINCSGRSTVILEFQQYFRYYSSSAAILSVFVSNNGTTWTEFDVRGAIDIVIVDGSPNPEIVKLNISAIAANQPTVYLRWHKQVASHYFWMVDDIILTEALNNDLKIENWFIDFFFPDNGYYNQIPLSQAEAGPIGYRAAVFNNGINEQTNVVLNVEALNYGNPVFNENSDTLNIPNCVIPPMFGRDTLKIFNNFIAVEEGYYQNIFNVTQDSINDDLSINTDTTYFTISNNVYARDNGIITGIVSPNMWVGGGVDGDIFGVAYDITAVDTVSSISIYIHENTNIGPSILAKLFHYDTVGGAWVEILNSALFDIDDSSKIDTWVTLPFIPTGTEVSPGNYIAAIECYFNGFEFWIAEDQTTPQSFWATRWNFVSMGFWSPFTNYFYTPFIRLNFLAKSGFVSGKIFNDLNADCIQDTGEFPISNLLIKAEPGPYYSYAYINGYYKIYTDTGQYTISLVLSDSLWQQNCPVSPDFYIVNVTSSDTNVSNINFGAIADFYCPNLSVDVSTWAVRPCFQSTYSVSYCNNGTVEATNATIEVELDDNMTYSSSTGNLISQIGNILTFDIGTVNIGQCGSFYLYVDVLCDMSLVGQTMCVQAHIYPDSTCFPADPAWDRSSVAVEGSCVADSLACFTIYNTGEPGTGDMAGTSEYRIYENNILVYTGTFQINGGDNLVICWTANGNTIRLEADQLPGHPGNSHPQDNVEMCGDSLFVTGQITVIPEDDEDYFVEIDCHVAIGSYDPNDKQVKPEGLTETFHFIDSTDVMEYIIHFQNTGTDTAFNVVIYDTLSVYLDITTIEPGSSSHPYTLDIFGSNILRWAFENILLPDSNANEPASNGFLKYKIHQIPGNTKGTVIENRAGIIFDFNEPVITNMVFNTVGNIDSLITNIPVIYAQDVSVKVYPNPFNSTTTFEIKGMNQPLTFELYNIIGEQVKAIYDINEDKFVISRENLPNGIYIYKISSKDKLICAGKLVVN